MADIIEIEPVDRPVTATITPPGSKSLTNRALIIAAMADGESRLVGTLDSDDTVAMADSLVRLGVNVSHDEKSATMVVQGTGGVFANRSAELWIGNSGTSVRFLSAMLGFAGGDYTLDGIERMRQRPIQPLVDAIVELGGSMQAMSAGGCPPVKIAGEPIVGGEVSLSGNLSSQYLSGLLMASPLARERVVLQIEGALISKPYVKMTCEVMKSFGVEVEINDAKNRFAVDGSQRYVAREYAIEPDASAASYFWAISAILGGTATVTGLNESSLQGDIGFVRCLEQMGCEVEFAEDSISVTGPAKRGIEIDMSDVSDTVQTLTAVALFVDGPTTVTNVAHNRVKETDRIGNLAIELRKFGVEVEEYADGLTVRPSGNLKGATIETYDDHRMAMSLSLVGLRVPGVKILAPDCVSKTYPKFFGDLKAFVQS